MKLVQDRLVSSEVFTVPTRQHGRHRYVQTTVKIYWFHILFRWAVRTGAMYRIRERQAVSLCGHQQLHRLINIAETAYVSGGLVVSMLASGTPSSRVQTRPKSLDFSDI